MPRSGTSRASGAATAWPERGREELMGDAKDRLGERLREKQKGEEDRYFSAKEREAIARLKVRKEADVVPEARGHCPRCGAKLTATKVHGVEVLQCPVDCG